MDERGKYGAGMCIGVPIGSVVAGEFFVHFQSMIKQMPRGITFNTVYVLRQPVDDARNTIVENSVKSTSKYTAMIDDDTLPPFYAFRRAMDLMDRHNYDAVVAPSWPKEVFTRPTIYDSVETPGLTNWNYGDVFEVYMAGFPFVVIRTECLVAMKEMMDREYGLDDEGKSNRKWFYRGQWFAERPGFDKQEYNGAEDFHFWYHWHKAGFKLLCDTWLCSDHVRRKTGQMFPTPDVINDLVSEKFQGKRFFQINFPMEAVKEGVVVRTPPVISSTPSIDSVVNSTEETVDLTPMPANKNWHQQVEDPETEAKRVARKQELKEAIEKSDREEVIASFPDISGDAEMKHKKLDSAPFNPDKDKAEIVRPMEGKYVSGKYKPADQGTDEHSDLQVLTATADEEVIKTTAEK